MKQTLSISGTIKVSDSLSRLESRLINSLGQAAKDAGQAVKKAVQIEIAAPQRGFATGAVATGKYLQSITFDSVDKVFGSRKIGTRTTVFNAGGDDRPELTPEPGTLAAPHAFFLNTDLTYRNRGGPPVENIIQWLLAKGLATSRDSKVWIWALRIARRIAAVGLRDRKHFEIAAAKSEPLVENIFQSAVEDWTVQANL